MIGPNSVVPPGRFIPSGQLWAGNPVQFVRNLTGPEKHQIKVQAEWHRTHGHAMNDEYSTQKTGYLFKENSEADLNVEAKNEKPLARGELDTDFFKNNLDDRI